MCEYCSRPEATDEEVFLKVQVLTYSLNNSTEDLTTLIYEYEPFDGVLEKVIHKASEIKRLRKKSTS